MICPVSQIVAKEPTAIFLMENQRSFSYSDLDQKAILFQNYFDVIALSNGDRLAISHCSSFDTAALLIASIRSGIILAILSDRNQTQHKKIINQYDLRYFDPQHFNQWKKDHPLQYQKQKWIISDPNQPCTMLFTSGSSSTPKAVLHSITNHYSSAHFSNQNIEYQIGDRWFLSLSLWHIGGLAILFRTIIAGATTIAKDRSLHWIDQITTKKITHLSLVSTQLSELLQSDRLFPSLKKILIGGGPIPPSLITQALEQKIPVATTYGMTELCSQCCTSAATADIVELRSAGSPIGDWDVRINQEGEIIVKGSPLFLGYWDGTTINSCRDAQGYFHTKDTGILKNGLLYPIGRIDQMFISGGENIHPEEIEKILCTIVEQAIVVPIPNAKYGSRPVAFLYGSFVLESVQSLLSQSLPKFKHPDHFYPWPSDIPTHKPPRKQLQSLALSLSQHP